MSPPSPAGGSSAALVPLFAALGDFHKKAVGVDVSLKAVLNIARLCMLYSADPVTKKRYLDLADAIIECRMLCNFGKHAITLHQGLGTLARRDSKEVWSWVFNCLSLFLRVPEQVSGDLNYLQKVAFQSWNREMLTFFFSFFKSLSLTFGLMVDLIRRPALQAAVNNAATPQQRAQARYDLRICDALIVRNLCDMYVYYKWIPFYNPIKTLEYSCGFLSGAISIWLVWREVRYSASS